MISRMQEQLQDLPAVVDENIVTTAHYKDMGPWMKKAIDVLKNYPKMKSDKIFDENVVLKPWGNEYVILRNKKLCITQLRITPKVLLSLHCHVKKTGFIVLEGKASIQLGLYKSTSEILTAPSKIMIRPVCFIKLRLLVKRLNSNRD